jgi:hypothetical protein
VNPTGRRGFVIGVFGLISTLTIISYPTDARADSELRFVPNVVGQFDALALRPDGMAFDPASSPDASKCKHYQGMARMQGADGTPYLFVTRSGVKPSDTGISELLCGGSLVGDDPGNLLVVRMGSRDKNGERLRSNWLRRGPAYPDPRDAVVKTITFDGGPRGRRTVPAPGGRSTGTQEECNWSGTCSRSAWSPPMREAPAPPSCSSTCRSPRRRDS